MSWCRWHVATAGDSPGQAASLSEWRRRQPEAARLAEWPGGPKFKFVCLARYSDAGRLPDRGRDLSIFSFSIGIICTLRADVINTMVFDICGYLPISIDPGASTGGLSSLLSAGWCGRSY